MNSPTHATTTPSSSLPAQLEQIGLHALAAGLDDFLVKIVKDVRIIDVNPIHFAPPTSPFTSTVSNVDMSSKATS